MNNGCVTIAAVIAAAIVMPCCAGPIFVTARDQSSKIWIFLSVREHT